MGIMRIASPLLVSRSSTAIGLTVTAIAIAIILLASNFTVINAQQSLTSQPGEIDNGTTTFQSTTDSFGVRVPEGWVIHDLNNTGSALLEETRQGYGILAQLCPEEEPQQQGAAASLTNASGDGGNTTLSCEPSENDVIHIVRYPDLDTRLLANNVTFDDNMSTDNILSYHLQKLQEVGYRSIQLVNSTDMTLNLTSPQTNETIATVPAKLVEMKYSTNSAPPNETRTGYFISTATNVTAPNLGTTKGYALFYEGNSTTNTNTTAATAAEITTAIAAASGSLLPPLLPPAVGQVFDSFELLAAPEGIAQEAAQAAEIADDDDDGANDDDDDDDGANDDDDDDDGANDDDDDDDGDDDDGADDDNGGDDDGADDYDGDDDDGADDDNGGDDDGATSDGGISSRGDRFAGDDYG
jgi:hypothetical protein